MPDLETLVRRVPGYFAVRRAVRPVAADDFAHSGRGLHELFGASPVLPGSQASWNMAHDVTVTDDPDAAAAGQVHWGVMDPAAEHCTIAASQSLEELAASVVAVRAQGPHRRFRTGPSTQLRRRYGVLVARRVTLVTPECTPVVIATSVTMGCGAVYSLRVLRLRGHTPPDGRRSATRVAPGARTIYTTRRVL